jgi:hypothetical protein
MVIGRRRVGKSSKESHTVGDSLLGGLPGIGGHVVDLFISLNVLEKANASRFRRLIFTPLPFFRKSEGCV